MFAKHGRFECKPAISRRAGVSLVTMVALGLGLSAAPAWADGGNGSGAGAGQGGVDGALASATGQNAANGASAGGGGGGVDLTTGNGAPGGSGGTASTLGSPNGAPGVTGGAGQLISTSGNISTSVSGGTGVTGPSGVAGSLRGGGGGGGGVGVSATADIVVTSSGSVAGGNGGIAGSNSNAGGGGGGVGVFSSADVTVEAGGSVTGGTGGRGGTQSGGGGGAAAIVLTGGGTIENSGNLVGGTGGRTIAAGGGDGGAGVLLLSGGTVINGTGATIIGGNGGQGGTAGDGGAGIKGANIAVINAGTISGGAVGAGGGTPIAGKAIEFTGGVNSLEIQAGSTITGNVVAFSTADTFKLGGDTNASFDVSQIGAGAKYDGFGSYEKTGTSTWTLTGTTTAVTPWTLSGGILQISSDSNLGNPIGGLTFNGGALQTTADITSARTVTLTGSGTFLTDAGTTLTLSNVISGAGGLTKAGDGTLVLTGINTFTGGTMISAGTLELVGTGSVAASSQVIADGTFSIAGIAGAGTSIQRLSGIGAVNLGGKTLTITAANDTFAGIISGSGGLTIAGGTQTLSGANNYTGPTTVSGGSLVAGAIGTFSAASAYTVAAPGMLNLDGFNQTLASLNNAGTVNFGSAPGTTLTITGNYVGNGGFVNMNTRLGGDGSQTDRLVVNGSTSGNSTLRVTNVGGTGAQTTEGIKVVDVAGASNGTFALQGNYVIQGQQAIVGGAYAYTLQQNGISTPGDGDWYLRSSLANPPPTAPAGPLYQPGVPLYENYGQVLLGMNELPTLQQRVGNRYWGGSDAMARAGLTPAQGDGSPTPSAFWGRVEGNHADLQPSNTTGSTYSADQMKVQAGLDGLALENERGRLIVGLTAQYGTSTANVASFFGNGRIQAEGSGVGGTLTWYGDNGFYVDGQAQTMFYRSDLSSALVGSMAHGNEGFGYAFSAESGKRIGVGNGWSLTPQAQLAYSKVDFDDFTDRFGALVSLGNADSLLGRAGLSLNHQKTWNDSGQIVRSDVYGIANLHYEFLNGANVDVAGTGFANANDRLWGSIGGGGTYSWASGRYTIFGEVSYNASLNNSDNRSYTGTGGFRVIW